MRQLTVTIPERAGERPTTGGRTAHRQLTQNAPVDLQAQLLGRAGRLPGLRVGATHDSAQGARAFYLEVGDPPGLEFGHLHPPYDGSLHLMLPAYLQEQATIAGWGERHPDRDGTFLVFGPRTPGELEVVWQLVLAAYHGALLVDRPPAAPAAAGA